MHIDHATQSHISGSTPGSAALRTTTTRAATIWFSEPDSLSKFLKQNNPETCEAPK